MKQPETNKYQDIIHLSRPRSQRHPPMSAHDRAGQFSPFAALTGFEAAIAETQRLTDSRIILEEGAKELLDQRMQEILERIETQPMVQILWFRYDPRKKPPWETRKRHWIYLTMYLRLWWKEPFPIGQMPL